MASRSSRLLTCTALAVAGVLSLVSAPALATTASPDAAPAQVQAAAQKVSVPAYFYPGATWDRLIAAGTRAGIAIANPDNGPGGGVDSQYTNVIRRATSAGIKVIGYVPTGYFGTTGMTTRTGSTNPNDWMRQIKGDVDTWYRLYGSAGVAGIFFDEGLARCGSGNVDVNRYIELKRYVEGLRGAAAIVVDNPGTGVDQCYSQAADTLVTFEGSGSSYRNHRPQAWEATAPADKIWHMVYDVPDQNSMREMMNFSRQRNAGHIYVTPDNLAAQNPWDSLPPQAYWDTELSLAAGA
ncbi:Spherulation-specific family 4 [Streptomyces sp. ADI96-02]|uniref:spherulation-specific family 4 protein n=1 Tax=Streptomyces sp. ADI96-02 TaxID=1522760 RepID=UPI000FB9424C|nr:spherulation-specific family 4 protein [Streptomyces sp. ADI96-02]RPK54877.1 Spherulation-specific family 4 [Streptomyces sp. ADI96-02]